MIYFIPHRSSGEVSEPISMRIVEVPDKDEIERIKKQIEGLGCVFVNEHCCENATEICLKIKVPYKKVVVRTMTSKEVLFQIAKMIASGEIPNEVHDKYLSDTPIGFMDSDTLFNYLSQDTTWL